MPASRPFIRKRVANTPVTEPAIAPARHAASVASQGLRPATSSVAATVPPSVSEPSTVRSRKETMRKLNRTPSARSDRIKPIVSEPMSSVIVIDPPWQPHQSAQPNKRRRPTDFRHFPKSRDRHSANAAQPAVLLLQTGSEPYLANSISVFLAADTKR